MTVKDEYMINDDDSGQRNSLWELASGQLRPNLASMGTRTPPPPSSANGLSQFFGRPIARGLYYNGKKLALDGYQFVECRFDNCMLLVSSTNFDLINCILDPKTMIEYGGEALKIVQLYNSRSEWLYENAPSLVPRRNADGTITISGTSQ
jgi:hypothetical protein